MQRWRDERGMALVVSLLVVFVVLILGSIVVAQAIHNSEQSGYNRKRTQSVDAAEAGLDYFYNYLATTPATQLTSSPITISLGTAPGLATAQVTPTYWADTAGTPFVGPITNTNYPKAVTIRATGLVNGTVQRTMESYVVLRPVYGGFEGAIVTNQAATFTNNFTVNGYNGNDGDLYVLNDDFNAPSGIESVKGNVYVPNGNASIGTNLHVFGQVWASGSVSVGHPSAQVDGDVKSTTSTISVTNGRVLGGAYYCQSPLIGASNISGSKVQTCSLGPPPSQAFPQIKYDGSQQYQDQWRNDSPSFTNFRTFTGPTACTDARDFIESRGAYATTGFSGHDLGNTLVFIDSTCTYRPSNGNPTVSMRNHLALITRGGINLDNQTNWNGEGSLKYLYLISAYPTTGSPSCPTQDITLSNNTNFNSLVSSIVYSPCKVTMNNNNTAFQGQVIGGQVAIGNNFNMTFLPVKVPGQNITGFEQDIAYIREVRS